LNLRNNKGPKEDKDLKDTHELVLNNFKGHFLQLWEVRLVDKRFSWPTDRTKKILKNKKWQPLLLLRLKQPLEEQNYWIYKIDLALLMKTSVEIHFSAINKKMQLTYL